jgi:hypothetical protein
MDHDGFYTKRFRVAGDAYCVGTPERCAQSNGDFRSAAGKLQKEWDQSKAIYD